MKPLRVDIVLQTPMVQAKELLHLDALLGAIKVRQVRKALGDGIDPRLHHHELPLERYTTKSGEWVFKASAFTLTPDIPSQQWMQTGKLGLSEAARHRNEGWLAMRAAKPVLGGGPFKHSIYYEALASGCMTAWCIGNQSEIEALLAECTQIGSRRGVGFGRVHAIMVEQIQPEECLWQHRALPLDAEEATKSHVPAWAGLHAPYWDKTLHHEVLMPTD